MARRKVGTLSALSALTVASLLLGALLLVRVVLPAGGGLPGAGADTLVTTSTPTAEQAPSPRSDIPVTVPPLNSPAVRSPAVESSAGQSSAGESSAGESPAPEATALGTAVPDPADSALAPVPSAQPAPDPVPEPAPPVDPPAAEPPAAAPAPVLPDLVPPYDYVVGQVGADRVAFLTFDDGPGPNTPAVLDILDAAGVRATFCQVGDQIDAHPDTERRIVAAGHTLCNHSWSHPTRLDTAAAAVVDDEMTRTQDALARFGATARWFRAPGGSFGTDDPTLRQVAQRHSLVPLGWEVDSQDWRKPGVQQIVETVLSTVRPGAVVLLHDAGGTDRDQTLAALPQIISGLRAAGYDLQPLPADGP